MTDGPSPRTSRRARDRVEAVVLPVLGVAVTLAAFEVAPRIGLLPRSSFPTFSEIFATLTDLVTTAEAVYLGSRIVVLSASPTRVKETIDVDLPRPRDQIGTKELPGFAHLRASVFASIKEESLRRPVET